MNLLLPLPSYSSTIPNPTHHPFQASWESTSSSSSFPRPRGVQDVAKRIPHIVPQEMPPRLLRRHEVAAVVHRDARGGGRGDEGASALRRDDDVVRAQDV